jgi:hypothetical protein
VSYSGGSLVPWFDDEFTTLTARAMAEKGGKELKRLIETKTPIDTGHLKDSWEQKAVSRSADYLGFAVYRSSVETNVDYAPYVEHGTGLWGPHHAKYPIRPKNPDGYLHWIGDQGEDVFAKLVMHPGSPGAHMVALSVAELAHVTDVFLQPELVIWAHHTENQNRSI